MLLGTARLALAACVLAACGDSKPVASEVRVSISARGSGSAGAQPEQAPAPVTAAEPAGAREGVVAVPDAVVWDAADLAPPPRSRAVAPEAEPSAGVLASLEILSDVPDGGALDEAAKAKLQEILVPQPDPRQSLDLEIALLRKGVYLRDAPLYDGAWRNAQHPKGWDVERQRAIARQWDRPYEMLVDGGKAVAFYRDAAELPPTFLRRKNMGWMIDASRTASMVVYDASRRSWSVLDQGSPYLSLIQRALPLRRMTLPDGRAAWQLEPGAPLATAPPE
jgi:hypothetical protein